MGNKQIILFGISVGAGVTLVLLLVFFTGLYVGSRRFGGFPFWERRNVFSEGFVPHRFGHGAVGVIDSLGNHTFVVKDRMGALKTILVDDKTIVRRDGSEAKFSDLKKDDHVIVVGEEQQEEGAIKARVIRVVEK